MIKSIFKAILCKHNYVMVRNIHGDEIIHLGYARSEWKCDKCGWITYSQYMNKLEK